MPMVPQYLRQSHYSLSWGQRLPTLAVDSVDVLQLSEPPEPLDNLPEFLQNWPRVLLLGLCQLFPDLEFLATWVIEPQIAWPAGSGQLPRESYKPAISCGTFSGWWSLHLYCPPASLLLQLFNNCFGNGSMEQVLFHIPQQLWNVVEVLPKVGVKDHSDSVLSQTF